MKKLLVAIAFLMSLSTFAEETISVTALQYENCWMTQTPDIIRIAEFSGPTPKAFLLDSRFLQGQLRKAIGDAAAQASPNLKVKGAYNAYLACSEGGHFISVNLYESTPKVVFKVRLDKLDAGTFALNDAKSSDFQLGSDPSSLVFAYSKATTKDALEKLLLQHFGYAIESTKFYPSIGSGTIRLKDAYAFQVEDVIAKLLANSEIGPLLESVVPNHLGSLPLESKLLFSGSF